MEAPAANDAIMKEIAGILQELVEMAEKEA